MANHCYLHLGSNIGNRREHLNTALQAINTKIGKVIKKSKVYETDAWGKEDQDDFLNIAVKISTRKTSNDILDCIQEIELELGRERKEHWGERTIDIDIIFYRNQIVKSDRLTIPHPLMEKRMFVLKPMMDIAAHYIHPILKQQIRTLYKNCKDNLEVREINE